MLTILPSKDKSTTFVEFRNTATSEDAEKLDHYVSSHFGENQPFNILAILHDIDGSTLKGMTSGLKFDAKRWGQFQKFAILTEKAWLASITELGNFLPMIKARHFDKNGLEAAWNWIQE